MGKGSGRWGRSSGDGWSAPGPAGWRSTLSEPPIRGDGGGPGAPAAGQGRGALDAVGSVRDNESTPGPVTTVVPARGFRESVVGCRFPMGFRRTRRCSGSDVPPHTDLLALVRVTVAPLGTICSARCWAFCCPMTESAVTLPAQAGTARNEGSTPTAGQPGQPGPACGPALLAVGRAAAAGQWAKNGWQDFIAGPGRNQSHVLAKGD